MLLPAPATATAVRRAGGVSERRDGMEGGVRSGMAGIAPGGDDAIDALTLDIATTGREAATHELQWIRERVAVVGFDPNALSRAGTLLKGLTWEGRTIASSDRLPTAVVHYLRHAVARQERPAGTTLDEYSDSLRQTILAPAGGVYLERYFGVWELSFVGPSEQWRGPGGAEWILVGYETGYGFWVTGFQPRDGLDYLTQKPDRTHGRWLQHPS